MINNKFLRLVLLSLCTFSGKLASSAQNEPSSQHNNNDYNNNDDETIAVDFPPLLDSDDIAYFFQRNDLDGLHWALSNVFARSDRNPSSPLHTDLPEQLVARGGGSTYTTQYKLEMDLEQALYLADTLQDQEKADFFRKTVVPIYNQVLSNIPPLEKLERTKGLYAFRPADYEAGIASVYNKALHHTDFDTLRDAETNEPIALLNPNLDVRNIEQQWLGNVQQQEDNNNNNNNNNKHPPGIVVVDNLLSEPALKRIRQLLLESTVWYQTKMPLQFGGYVGAYLDDGLHDRILLQLAMELYQTFPRVMMEGHPLRYMWAYKYNQNYTGIHLHADEAAVNVNVWLTPDEANLDENSGGLVVFTAKPPADWDFYHYNTDTDLVVEQLLRPTNFANVTIPHKQNRAVVFDSALFHQTDHFDFREGYQHRRINLTFLYGIMNKAESSSSGKEEL